jgi:predicted short-subunit dehydrogenase-like oxidoreductase (DUF2520 family)
LAAPPLILLGAGAAGTAIARAARDAGWPIEAVVSRSAARAAERAALIGAGSPLTHAELLARGAAAPVLLLLGVPDRAIAATAQSLASRAWPPGCVALHLSGSVEVEALQPLRARGVAVGGCHPLASFVDAASGGAGAPGTVAAVEGDAPAVAVARQLAAALGWQPFALQPGRRAAWHAAASHACNHLVALLDQSLDLMQAAGLTRDQARAALLPLQSGTLDNLATREPAAALTGPIARGDVEVVRRHLRALAGAPPDVRAAYRALALRALELARTRGLPAAAADELAALLREETP